MKKLDIFFLIIGLAFIGYGGYVFMDSLFDNLKKEEVNEDKPIIKTNLVEENLINTCWNNEILAEETSDQKRKLLCFDENGDFTYKYTREDTIVEGFESYKKFSYDDSNTIKLISSDKNTEDLEFEIVSVKKEDTLSIKYEDRLVYFIYYCRL